MCLWRENTWTCFNFVYENVKSIDGHAFTHAHIYIYLFIYQGQNTGYEVFEDTKRKSKKDRQHNGRKSKRTTGQTMIYKTLHIKEKIV
jgi:hypothetical protein